MIYVKWQDNCENMSKALQKTFSQKTSNSNGLANSTWLKLKKDDTLILRFLKNQNWKEIAFQPET